MLRFYVTSDSSALLTCMVVLRGVILPTARLPGAGGLQSRASLPSSCFLDASMRISQSASSSSCTAQQYFPAYRAVCHIKLNIVLHGTGERTCANSPAVISSWYKGTSEGARYSPVYCPCQMLNPKTYKGPSWFVPSSPSVYYCCRTTTVMSIIHWTARAQSE
jgi:hypothetical protein